MMKFRIALKIIYSAEKIFYNTDEKTDLSGQAKMHETTNLEQGLSALIGK